MLFYQWNLNKSFHIKHRIKNTCLYLPQMFYVNIRKLSIKNSQINFFPGTSPVKPFCPKDFGLTEPLKERKSHACSGYLTELITCFHIYSYKRICMLFTILIKFLIKFLYFNITIDDLFICAKFNSKNYSNHQKI